MNAIYPLFSSSKGNAIFIGNSQRGILIDCGVSYKRLEAAMKRCGLDISAVKAVFITHEHGDHIKGLPVLTKKQSVKVYAQSMILRKLFTDNLIHENSQALEINISAELFDMKVTAFDTPHDALQSCGYRVDFADGSSCAVCTDLGCVTEAVDAAVLGVGTVLLESNYDEDMMLFGRYPRQLKQRICSERGHLSNDASSDQAFRLVRHGTKNLILGHLSEENNTPELAESAVTGRLSGFVRDRDYFLMVAKPETTGDMVVI
ncbi:MBL fold metallo-hydrolase [Ruminococcus sp. HUN007]|uniref:MBL fold metallo-hydrolase n=1 Tax=Ruminococcus sp. HUN007 TaxID=1514668 RepID=UPI0005D295D3|nr:MBL fold metallo-hydrolase [Ruminococcus sp. HUN007]